MYRGRKFRSRSRQDKTKSHVPRIPQGGGSGAIPKTRQNKSQPQQTKREKLIKWRPKRFCLPEAKALSEPT